MFERFTQEARDLIVRAQAVSRAMAHGYIGTEHLLLALCDEPATVRLLSEAGFDRDAFEATLEVGSASLTAHVPFTPRAKRALETSLRESVRMRTPQIHPAHILVGVVRDEEGKAGHFLRSRGVDVDRLVAAAEATLSDAQGPVDPQIFEQVRYAQAAASAIVQSLGPAEAPGCPSCRADLSANLKCRTVHARGESETVPVRIFYCGQCGRAINAGGGDEGAVPAHG